MTESNLIAQVAVCLIVEYGLESVARGLHFARPATYRDNSSSTEILSCGYASTTVRFYKDRFTYRDRSYSRFETGSLASLIAADIKLHFNL